LEKKTVTIREQTLTLERNIKNFVEENQELDEQLELIARISEKHPEQRESYEQQITQLKEKKVNILKSIESSKTRLHTIKSKE